METMMPTSFIPKRPVNTEPLTPKTRSHSGSFLSLIATLAVFVTAVSYVGIFLYTKQLNSQKIKIDTQIADAKKGIGTTFLSDMKRLDGRIESVKTLLGKHIVVSPIFMALEQTTLHSIQYKSFTYEYAQDQTNLLPTVKVTLTGVSKGYPTIALQSDAFTQNSLIKNPVFSGLTVDDKTNAVSFKLTFDVDPAALSYEAFINSLSKPTPDSSTGVPITSTVQ